MLLDRSGKKWTTKIVLSYSVHIFSYTETFQSVHGQRATVICVSTWDVTGGEKDLFHLELYRETTKNPNISYIYCTSNNNNKNNNNNTKIQQQST